MIEHLLKWLKLMPLPNHNNEGVAYAFSDRVINRFEALTKVFTSQGIKFPMEFYICMKI
jgi:hypothetical protein